MTNGGFSFLVADLSDYKINFGSVPVESCTNMGCGSSRSVSTIEPSPVRGRLVKDSTSSVKPSKGVPNNNSRISIPTDKNNESESYGHSHSCTNVNNISTKRREISATSTRTADSGISESEDGEILTENSNPSKLNQVRASERPITPGNYLHDEKKASIL